MGEQYPSPDPIVSALAAMRVSRGLSQREVTRRLGTSTASLSDWERGAHSPTLSNLRAWAEVLGFKIALTEAR